MTKYGRKTPMIAIEDVDPLAEITMSKGIFDDLLQVLREADADLAGMLERWHYEQFELVVDRKAAAETREHIAAVYKVLTGHGLGR